MARNTAIPIDSAAADSTPPASSPTSAPAPSTPTVAAATTTATRAKSATKKPAVAAPGAPPPTPPTSPPAPPGDDKTNAGVAPGTTPQSAAALSPASAFVRWASFAFSGAFFAAGVLFVILAVATVNDKDRKILLSDGRWWSLAFAFGTVGFGLLILHLTGRDKGYGIFRPLIGTDVRFSTSLTQLGLWTVAVVTAVGFLLGRVMFEGATLAEALSGKRWDEYLLLLGGPFAAAVIAKGVVTYKVSAGTLQKSDAPAASPAQVLTSDHGNADLIDAQYLLFNVVALAYFVVQVVRTSELPEMPAPLLALTSGTAAAYVASKAAARNAPTITSVTPTSVKPGGQVRVFGTNFDPADKNDVDRRITVALGGWTDTIYPTTSKDTEVIFTLPAAVALGEREIR